MEKEVLPQRVKIKTENLNLWFKEVQAIKSLNIEIFEKEILTIIGPANSGKTSFLRVLNRLVDLNPSVRVEGRVYLEETDIYSRDIDVEMLRRKVGMVFALPVPLPLSVFDNVAYGPRRCGIKKKAELEEIVKRSLQAAYLWDEVKHRLREPAQNLSGGQQQRLGIARILAVEPEVILFDEPCSGLDPISTAKIEEAMHQLKKRYTLILVTNNTKQAARVGDRTAFFLMGELIELDRTDKIFTSPSDKRTEGYITGRFG